MGVGLVRVDNSTVIGDPEKLLLPQCALEEIAADTSVCLVDLCLVGLLVPGEIVPVKDRLMRSRAAFVETAFAFSLSIAFQYATSRPIVMTSLHLCLSLQ